jgi:hypothetical protein
MKTKSYYLGLVLLGFLTWSCSNKDELSGTSGAQGSLKTSITASAQNLTTAMTAITTSAGYQVLAITAPTSGPNMVQSTKTTSATFASAPLDTISLSGIAGIYDYKAANYKRWHPELLNFFVKSGTSSDFIVRLPKSKVTNPGSLLHFTAADTTLVNNYVIDVTKYNYDFGRFLWNYSLASTITVDNVEAGALTIQSSNNRANGYHYMSDFAFANGYDAKMVYYTGDTILSDYSISKGGTILFEEQFTSIKADTATRHREKQYTLIVGNVKIVRNPTPGNNGLDSAKVYVGGVLQTKAKVQIVDNTTNKSDTTEFSIIDHRRDLKITFDDGTTQTVSQLLGSAITDVRTLFTSLRQVYFATSVVDWVAWDIYMNKKNM